MFSSGENFLGKLYTEKTILPKIFQGYRKLNAIWKRSKTSWNPTVHTNNIISNFFLLDAHDVPLKTFLNYGFKVYSKKGQESLNKLDLGFGESNTYEDLVKYGVFDAGLAKAELNIGKDNWTTSYAKEFLSKQLQRKNKTTDSVDDATDALDMATKFSENSYKSHLKTIAKDFKDIPKDLATGLKKTDATLTDLYQREDQMFRVALYIDRLQKRVPELNLLPKGSEEYGIALEKIKRQAAFEAKRGFIDYQIESPFINLLRDTALPFFSYTYRIIPILAKTATLKPSKFAKWASIGYALDYAGKERNKEEVERERAYMDEKKLTTMFGLPFMPYTFIKASDIPREIEKFAEKRFDFSLYNRRF